MRHCKNCGKALHDSYCGHCGQKALVDRITFSYLLHEIIHFFMHVEKGFLFTSLQMLKSPGKTVKDFIDGKHKSYQSPISYFLIWITIYILFLYLVQEIFGENIAINYKEYFGPSATTKFAITHLGFVLTIIIPFQALYLFLLVTRGFYNYFETMAASIYSLGTIILLQFVFAIVAVIIYLISSVSIDLRVSDLLKVFYLTWFIISVIKLFPVKIKFLRAIAFLILAFGTFTVWRLYGFAAIADWFFLKK